MVFD